MATYSQRCSQVGTFSYATNFVLYIILTDRDGNPSTDKSKVDYNVYCSSDGSGSIRANHDLYFSLNGTVIRNENVYVNVSSPNANIPIASGTLEVKHNDDGSKAISFSASINATGGFGVSATKSGTFTLTTIDRYAKINSCSVKSTTLTTAVIQYSVSKNANIYCSVDGGVWGNPRVTNTSSGTFTISNLSPNARHSFRILSRVTYSGTNLDKTSSYFYGTTLDYARVTNASDSEYGQPVALTFSNLANGTCKLQVKIGDDEICERINLTTNYTLVFSQEELSTMVKLMKNENTEITYTVITNNTYKASRTAIIILKKNVFYKKNGSWLKSRLYKKDVEWKKTKLFYKFSGSWRNTV